MPSTTVNIVISREFSDTPGGRYIKEGKYSGMPVVSKEDFNKLTNHINKTLKQIGDEIVIKAIYGKFTYQVESTKIINAKDNDAFPFYRDKEILMLYTCYPVNTIGHKTQRFLVYAKKVGESYEK